jgi:hypothetical protein
MSRSLLEPNSIQFTLKPFPVEFQLIELPIRGESICFKTLLLLEHCHLQLAQLCLELFNQGARLFG